MIARTFLAHFSTFYVLEFQPWIQTANTHDYLRTERHHCSTNVSTAPLESAFSSSSQLPQPAQKGFCKPIMSHILQRGGEVLTSPPRCNK